MSSEELIRAAAVLVGGLVVAAILALAVRRTLSAAKARALSRSATDAASLTFWIVLAAAVAVTIGLLSPGSLDPVPTLILAYLPRILSAGLILIAGRALAAIAGRFVVKATERAAVSSVALEAGVRWVIIGLAIVLALSQLGIDTVILQVLVAALAAAVALAFGLMTGLGGRDVAGNVAAGRIIRQTIAVGTDIRLGEVAGRVEMLGPVTIALRLSDGSELHLPYQQLLESGFHVDRAV